MSETKQFGIGAILTVTGGPLMCDIGDVYKLLGWLTGEDLMTHQLPRASRESEDFLREQFPDLAAVTIPEWGSLPFWNTMGDDEKRTAIEDWLSSLSLGTTRAVPRLPEQHHTRIDPFTELRMLRPDADIIAVHIPRKDES